MNKNFFTYISHQFRNFVIAVSNIFIFLPHFFSVKRLFNSLTRPWKNITTKKKQPGFSFEEWFGVISFNIISRAIGIFMRLSLIMSFFIIQIFFIIFLPTIAIFFLLTQSIAFFIKPFMPTIESQEDEDAFVGPHLLNEENREHVKKWYHEHYRKNLIREPWWTLNLLLSTAPLGRDWTAGYTPTLDQYGVDLTFSKPHYINLVGRNREIKEISQILSKSQEANVILVGEEGVGKRTIIEAFASKIHQGRINPLLSYKRIIKIDLEKILSGSEDLSKKEEALKLILKEASDAGNIIIFIDNFHKYVAQSEESIDLTASIAEYAGSDKLQFIAVTTPFAYQKYIFPNDKISRFFEKVDAYEATADEALSILLSCCFDFEKRFGLIIPYETLKETVDKSGFYITSIPFPEKAIELLDRSCVYANEILPNKSARVLAPEMVDIVLSEKTHIPVNLTENMKTKLLNLETFLSAKIISQKEGITKLSAALRKSFIMLGKRKKPLASFMFLGPTGVGKTETAKALTEVFFDSEQNFIRFDMSLYQTKDMIDDLVGSQETGNPGLLTSAIRQKPYGVLLLDEIEKASSDLLNIFLTVLDEGYFTDGTGHRVDCKNLMVIATSNAGSDFIYKLLQDNQGLGANIDKELINHLIESKIFSPEFLNRFDGVVVYKPLNQETISQIAKKMLYHIGQDVYRLHHVKFSVSDIFLRKLIEKGYDPNFGARNMQRVIRDEVEDKIAKLILERKINPGEIITF